MSTTGDSSDSLSIENWGHYTNIHRYIWDMLKMCVLVSALFKELVCITEKIDGSNLGIHISKTKDGKWYIVTLLGRNAPIFTVNPVTMDTPSPNLSYGNAGILGNLPSHMMKFAILVAEEMGVNEIIIYGEAFRASKNDKPVRHPSWHPFGVKVKKDNVRVLYRMTTRLHQLFSKVAICMDVDATVFASHENLNTALINADSTLITPPPIMFSGPLGAAIDLLHPHMMNTDKNFEGVFVVLENGHAGFKWKTGVHDEQSKIYTAEEMNIDDPDALRQYKKLEEIFNNRPGKEARIGMLNSKKATENKEAVKKHLSQLNTDTKTAIARVLSKSASWDTIPTNKRHSIIENLVVLVVDEVKNRYTESDDVVPYEDSMIINDAQRQLTPIVMRVPFNQTGGAAAAVSFNNDDV